MKEYVTLQSAEITCEKIIEKSRFIASATRVESVESAVSFIASKKKKYFDATHNCFAYIVGDKAKFGDDGEPQGTAGMPIYECIKNNGIDYACVVVTRYFGGIKLGAGGLVRAYGGSCAEVLRLCERVQMRDCYRAEAIVEYSALKILRKAMQGYALEEDVTYDDKVRVQYLFLYEMSSTIADIVSQCTFGRGNLILKERKLCPYRM